MRESYKKKPKLRNLLNWLTCACSFHVAGCTDHAQCRAVLVKNKKNKNIKI